MAEKQKQYFNDAQLYPLYMSPRDFVGEMGRGTGKGLIDATRLMQVAFLEVHLIATVGLQGLVLQFLIIYELCFVY